MKLGMKAPELTVFLKTFTAGIVIAEVFRVAFYVGQGFSPILSDVEWGVQAFGIFIGLLICFVYMWKREAGRESIRLIKSFRVDLLVAVVIGFWLNDLIAPVHGLEVIHRSVQQAGPMWASATLSILLLALLSPLGRRFCFFVRTRFFGSAQATPQLNFLTDEEIRRSDDDVFGRTDKAQHFAETVLTSKAQSGLVFGVDGAWGVGKTSFINIAEHHWKRKGSSSVIVFRFEPLRYASDPDLSKRLIRDLIATIQHEIFTPELGPVASRYSRMLKGKPDISFFGFRISLDSAGDTVDNLLDDIDEVLKQAGRRLIIVIDDLDRLDVEAVNNVLFTVRRTFKLSQAVYILCYDTENLIAANGEGDGAREFVEKFVTVKQNLIIESSMIKKYLEHDWSSQDSRNSLAPAENMIKLASVLSELAKIMGGEKAAKYMPLIGDLRKVKRFINAVLILQIQEVDLGKTDFDPRDLVNLMLLNIVYPGIFRLLHAEETGGRVGMFSVRRDTNSFVNSEEFTSFLAEQSRSARFLLEELFAVEKLGLGARQGLYDNASRACFNEIGNRNLEKYLNMIVKFAIPESQETVVMYRDAVDQLLAGATVREILERADFSLEVDEHTHDRFWSMVVNQLYRFDLSAANGAIDFLVEYLPRYSSAEHGLRPRSIYTLLKLLDRLGDKAESRVSIADKILDSGNEGMIFKLKSDRGVLGWRDLILFRLLCSGDRGGQLYNIQSALILHEDSNAPTSGPVRILVQDSMRKLSQKIFEQFHADYIEPKKNFFTDVDEALASEFLAEHERGDQNQEEGTGLVDDTSLENKVAAARTSIKTFVLYQLANCKGATGSGIGCGFYDEAGNGDSAGIAERMNRYVFEDCFNPDVSEDNAKHFADYCLSSFSNAFFIRGGEEGYVPHWDSLCAGLNADGLIKYWRVNRESIMALNMTGMDRTVVTDNYSTTYSESLQRVFELLDEHC